MNLSKSFTKFSRAVADFSGRPMAFAIACGLIVLWLICGPIFGFSDTWQLVINTGTTIVTFIMVFLIQNTQNRDSCTIQIKLDELIRAKKGADNSLLDLEGLSQEQLDEIRSKYTNVGIQTRGDLKAGLLDNQVNKFKR